jgi:hypothetical protein
VDIPTSPPGRSGYHILDVLISIEEAITGAGTVTIDSTVTEIPLVPADRDPHAATL